MHCVVIAKLSYLTGSPVNNKHSHLLKEDLVLLVSSAAFHLVIQLGDDLVLELQSGTTGVNIRHG